jgi:hypothetical protein
MKMLNVARMDYLPLSNATGSESAGVSRSLISPGI